MMAEQDRLDAEASRRTTREGESVGEGEATAEATGGEETGGSGAGAAAEGELWHVCGIK